MKIIKSLVLVITLAAGLYSTTFAAWWNPLSWQIFSKENKNVTTQQITVGKESNLVKPISIRLQATSSPEVQKVKQVPVAKPKVPQEMSSTNYNFLVLGLVDSLISTYQSYYNLYSEYDRIYLARMLEVNRRKDSISKIQLSPTGSEDVIDRTVKAFLSLQDTEISFVSKQQAWHQTVMVEISTNLSILRSFKEKAGNSVYTKQEAISAMQGLMKYYDIIDEKSKDLRDSTSAYNLSVDKYDKVFSATVQYFQRYVDNNPVAPEQIKVESPREPIIPKLELPKTTSCTIHNTGLPGDYSVICN